MFPRQMLSWHSIIGFSITLMPCALKVFTVSASSSSEGENAKSWYIFVEYQVSCMTVAIRATQFTPSAQIFSISRRPSGLR